MNLKKILTRAPLPERDVFRARLSRQLFSHVEKEPAMMPRFFSLSLMTGGAAFAVIAMILLTSVRPTENVLAAALTNTIAFTKSNVLVRQDIHTRRIAGAQYVGMADGIVSASETRDADGNIVPPPQVFDVTRTEWRYQDNARWDETIVDDSTGVATSTSTSDLISDIDHSKCEYRSNDPSSLANPSEKTSCNSQDSLVHLQPLVNDGSLAITNLHAEKSTDPQGDIYVTWETASAMQNPVVFSSIGPSGFITMTNSGVYSWKNDVGRFNNRQNFFSQDLRVNAENSFYQGDDSAKIDIQIHDDTGRSNVYILNIDDFSLTPVSDAELSIARENFQKLVAEYSVSANSLEQDTELAMANIGYLQDHIAKLQLVDQHTSNGLITTTYTIPVSVGLNGGTNNTPIIKATFVIDEKTQLITNYQLFDTEGTEVENATISRTYPSEDPEMIFGKSAWEKSVDANK